MTAQTWDTWLAGIAADPWQSGYVWALAALGAYLVFAGVVAVWEWADRRAAGRKP